MMYHFSYFGTQFSCSASDDWDAFMQANSLFEPARQSKELWEGHQWIETGPNTFKWQRRDE